MWPEPYPKSWIRNTGKLFFLDARGKTVQTKVSLAGLRAELSLVVQAHTTGDTLMLRLLLLKWPFFWRK